ncbi:MAG: PKD domain-containing protein, partial [Gammaproteobacteria bacterium]
QTVNAGILIVMDGTGSSDPDNGPSPLTYEWTQISGPTVSLTGATTAQPSFTPTIAGTYIFSLIVNDSLASSPADTVTISVNARPMANAGFDQAVNAGSLVTLNGTASSDPDNGPSPLTYEWTQISGPTVSLTGATTAQPSFTPTIAGTYIFSLIVNDDLATSTADVVTISVNAIPIADAGPDQNLNVASPVTLNGTGSSDPDNGPLPLTYKWTQDSGPTVSLSGATSAQPSFTPLMPGTYIFSLVVNDGKANSTADAVTVTVNDADYVVVQSPNGGEVWNEKSKQTISWLSHHLNTKQRLQIYLSLDNGVTWKLISSPRNVGHKTWSIPKNRYVTKQALLKICVKNNRAICDVSDKVFTINNKPVADAGVKQKVALGTRVILNGGASYDLDNGPFNLHYNWIQVRGPVPLNLNGADTVTPDFTPTVKGLYKFRLTVNDGAAESKKDKVSVRVVDML